MRDMTRELLIRESCPLHVTCPPPFPLDSLGFSAARSDVFPRDSSRMAGKIVGCRAAGARVKKSPARPDPANFLLEVLSAGIVQRFAQVLTYVGELLEDSRCERRINEFRRSLERFFFGDVIYMV